MMRLTSHGVNEGLDMNDTSASEISIRLWSEDDLSLLERLMGDPAMMVYLGGPETPEKIRHRHARYCQLADSGKGYMFVIVVGADKKPAGSIGYWEHEGQDQLVWETGWSVLPEFQGQGIATRAIPLVLDHARANGRHRFMHAYPSVDNGASNAICRKASFTLEGVFDFEYPPGNPIRCNDWALDLFGSATEQNGRE
jgi:RimJ/RimL family protein N-acetyltransferase